MSSTSFPTTPSVSQPVQQELSPLFSQTLTSLPPCDLKERQEKSKNKILYPVREAKKYATKQQTKPKPLVIYFNRKYITSILWYLYKTIHFEPSWACLENKLFWSGQPGEKLLFMASTSESLSNKSKSFFHTQIKAQNLLKTNKHLPFLKKTWVSPSCTTSINYLATEPGPPRLKWALLKAETDV